MDHTGLITQVKGIQKSGDYGKNTWAEYCDTHLGGSRDPSRHDANTLSGFIAAYNSGSLPQPSAQPPAQGKGMGGGMGGKGGFGGKGSMGKGDMIEMLKGMMGMGGGGSTGGVAGGAAGGAAGGGSDLTEFVKMGQRCSPSFKASWTAYCTSCGTGKFDPKGYERDFIAGFAEYIGGLAAKDQGIEVDASAGQKRPMPFMGGMGKRLNTGPAENLDPVKADLVNRVKNVQKSMPGGRDAWGSYSDMHAGGTRDPSKLENEVLLNFLYQMGA